MRVVKQSPGVYKSEDGRYTISREPYERDCECTACQVGYTCPFGGIATDYFWPVWDEVTDDYVEGTGLMTFERFRDAKAFVQASS